MEKGQHQPIISEETWEKAQYILKSRSRTPNRIHSGDFPLTGIMKCPSCGASMVLGRTTNRNKDGSKRILEYYVCGAWKNKGTAVCHSNGVRTEYADRYVIGKIATLANSDQLIKDIVRRINSGKNNKTDPLQKKYELLKKSLNSIQSRINKVLSLFEEGLVEKGDLVERLQKLNEEKRLTEERLVPLQMELGQDSFKEVSYNMVKEVMANFFPVIKNQLQRSRKKGCYIY